MIQQFLALPACCALLAARFTVRAIAAESTPPAHHHAAATGASAPPPAFVASTAKRFSVLMDDAMNVMNDGMARAPMNGDPDHDFASMMIPHHQGAVDMAKAVLLYGKNPVLPRTPLTWWPSSARCTPGRCMWWLGRTVAPWSIFWRAIDR